MGFGGAPEINMIKTGDNHDAIGRMDDDDDLPVFVLNMLICCNPAVHFVLSIK